MRFAIVLIMLFGCASVANMPLLGALSVTPHVCNPGEDCVVSDVGPCPDGSEPLDIALNVDTGKWEKVCEAPAE